MPRVTNPEVIRYGHGAFEKQSKFIKLACQDGSAPTDFDRHQNTLTSNAEGDSVVKAKAQNRFAAHTAAGLLFGG
jgi:hypothetical protein